jgi:hypothetical protein
MARGFGFLNLSYTAPRAPGGTTPAHEAHVDLSDLSNLSLGIVVFFYSLNLAPMMFETFTSDRTWASHPPESFSMFLGPYGQKTAHYWRIVSPLATLSFVATLVLNWRIADRQLPLLVAFTLFIAVQGATMAYFVREQEGLIAGASGLSREVLATRARRWMSLNYLRNIAGVLAFAFLMCAAFVEVP